MNLRFTPRALRELDDILSYIASNAPAAAKRVHTRLQRAFDVVARNPKIGRPTSHPRLRRLAMTPYPYLVFYRIDETEVVVIGIRHTRRDPALRPDR